jgi:riboflavin biosynthesis pyrimidine reductase
MPRPQVVLNVFASLDGRIATSPGRNVMEWTAAGLDGGANRIAHALCDELQCDALLSGSESLLVYGNHWVNVDPPISMPKAMATFVVVDGQGRINWQHTEGVVVVTREDVSPAYIRQLEDKQIRYIQAGTGHHVDLHQAMEALYELGIRRLGLTGGGRLNGACLRAGLIDEVSIVFRLSLWAAGIRPPSLTATMPSISLS